MAWGKWVLSIFESKEPSRSNPSKSSDYNWNQETRESDSGGKLQAQEAKQHGLPRCLQSLPTDLAGSLLPRASDPSK